MLMRYFCHRNTLGLYIIRISQTKIKSISRTFSLYGEFQKVFLRFSHNFSHTFIQHETDGNSLNIWNTCAERFYNSRYQIHIKTFAHQKLIPRTYQTYLLVGQFRKLLNENFKGSQCAIVLVFKQDFYAYALLASLRLW